MRLIYQINAICFTSESSKAKHSGTGRYWAQNKATPETLMIEHLLTCKPLGVLSLNTWNPEDTITWTISNNLHNLQWARSDRYRQCWLYDPSSMKLLNSGQVPTICLIWLHSGLRGIARGTTGNYIGLSHNFSKYFSCVTCTSHSCSLHKREQGWRGVLAKILSAPIPFLSPDPLSLQVLRALSSSVS